mmetsp:Transcript_15933/g.50044  ORF Transcript_15933/g.50044 Transcript_15933/m.50044 type:complete len:348 (+) Transcript_15933:126-1169(+)
MGVPLLKPVCAEGRARDCVHQPRLLIVLGQLQLRAAITCTSRVAAARVWVRGNPRAVELALVGLLPATQVFGFEADPPEHAQPQLRVPRPGGGRGRDAQHPRGEGRERRLRADGVAGPRTPGGRVSDGLGVHARVIGDGRRLLVPALHAEACGGSARPANVGRGGTAGAHVAGCPDDLRAVHQVGQHGAPRGTLKGRRHRSGCGCRNRNLRHCCGALLLDLHWGLLLGHCKGAPDWPGGQSGDADRHHLHAGRLALVFATEPVGPVLCVCSQRQRDLPDGNCRGLQGTLLHPLQGRHGDGGLAGGGGVGAEVVELRSLRRTARLQHRPVCVCGPHECRPRRNHHEEG